MKTIKRVTSMLKYGHESHYHIADIEMGDTLPICWLFNQQAMKNATLPALAKAKYKIKAEDKCPICMRLWQSSIKYAARQPSLIDVSSESEIGEQYEPAES